MTVKNIIFDFDGTLANSKNISQDIVLKVTQKFNVRNFDISHIDQLEDMSMRQILKKYNVRFYKIPAMLIYFRYLMSKNISKLELIEGFDMFLSEFENNLSFFIMSSNSQKNINRFLKQNNIEKYFKEISTSLNLFGKSRKIKKIIKKYNLDPSHTIYIGDEVRDIEAATKAGIKTISVTWGFNSRRTLEKHKPLHIVDTVEELKRFLLKNL